MNEFSDKTKKYIELINDELTKSYISSNSQLDKLTNAMHYSLSNGGKRIRPILMMEFCQMCGGNCCDALPAACALESIHTFSLIHDDLPCMDDDDLRRGKPSCHKTFGEDIALLAGDSLALDAFGKITEMYNLKSVNAETALRVVYEISKASGFSGMCGGQLLDLENETNKPDESRLDYTHKLKTGALISTACKCGAIIGGADEELIDFAEQFGYKLGLAFQIIDDILDVEGDEKLLGKPIGSDEQQDKTTYVSLYDIDGAKKAASKLTEQALNILNKFDNNEYINEITKELLIRKK